MCGNHFLGVASFFIPLHLCKRHFFPPFLLRSPSLSPFLSPFSSSRPPAHVSHPTFFRAAPSLLSHHDVSWHSEPRAPCAQRSSWPPAAFSLHAAYWIQDGDWGGHGQSQAGGYQGEGAFWIDRHLTAHIAAYFVCASCVELRKLPTSMGTGTRIC